MGIFAIYFLADVLSHLGYKHPWWLATGIFTIAGILAIGFVLLMWMLFGEV